MKKVVYANIKYNSQGFLSSEEWIYINSEKKEIPYFKREVTY
jgi:hypothetical protein